MTCFVYHIMNCDCSDALSRIRTRTQIRMVVSGSMYVRILPKQSRALRYERPRTCIGGGSAVAATTKSIVSSSLVCCDLPCQPLTFSRVTVLMTCFVYHIMNYNARMLSLASEHVLTYGWWCRVVCTCTSFRSNRERCVTSIRVLAFTCCLLPCNQLHCSIHVCFIVPNWQAPPLIEFY